MSPERIEWHLWNWERWMESAAQKGGYAKFASGGFRGYTTLDRDNDAAYEEMDRVAGAAVQACLDGMEQRLRIAVYVQHGIMAAVYRVRDAETAYAQACTALGVMLDRRGVC